MQIALDELDNILPTDGPPVQNTTLAQTAPISEVNALGDLNSDGLLTVADGVVNYAGQAALMRYLALFCYGDCRDLTITDYLANPNEHGNLSPESEKALESVRSLFREML